jgi:hypothetical protein
MARAMRGRWRARRDTRAEREAAEAKVRDLSDNELNEPTEPSPYVNSVLMDAAQKEWLRRRKYRND